MAGSRLNYHPYQNPSRTGGDKPTESTQRSPPANNSDVLLPVFPPTNSCIPTPTIFYTTTPALVLASAPTSAPTSALAPAPALVFTLAKYTNANFH